MITNTERSNEQLLSELADLRQRIAELEATDSERERVAHALQKRTRDLALLTRAGQTLTAILDSQEVITQLLHAVTETIGAQASSVWLLDDRESGWLVCQAAFDSGQDYELVDVRLPPGKGIAGWVAQNAESVIASQVVDDPRFASEVDSQIDFRTLSLLAVPLQLRNTVIGVLEVVNKFEGDFDEDDKAVVETLAASASIALVNARLVEQLRQHTSELQQRNEDLDAFAHTVAHDLKSPTGIIVGYAAALEESFDGISSDDLRRHLRTIWRNGRKMNSIIKELLLMASVGTAQVAVQAVDMAAIVSESQDRVAHLIDEHQADVNLPEKWPPALGYAPWIEEVWVNYISNAIKYGGDPPAVELGATPLSDGSIRFWARDNGPGLNRDDQNRLFAPFTQLAPTRAEGHGLGLSIVQRIVDKLGGKVGVESEIGQGSTFYFTLQGVP